MEATDLMLRRCGLVLLIALLPTALPAVYLTRVGTPTEQSLRALPGGKLLVRQTTEVYLEAGENAVTFLLPATGVKPEQVRLRPLAEGLTVGAAEFPTTDARWMRWLVQAPAAGPARFTLSYPAPDLTWEPVYAVQLRGDRVTWETWVRVVNQSTRDWSKLTVTGLPWADLTAAIAAQSDARLPLVTFPDLPATRTFRYESERYGTSVVELLTLPRGEGDFGAESLPPGKLEISEGPPQPSLPARVADVAYTPRRCDLVVPLGPAPGLGVGRRLLASRRVNLRMDVDGRCALYDLDEEYQVTVSNRRAAECLVTFIEPLPGPGEVIESSAPWTTYDATHLRFDLTVPAQADVNVTYRLRRANLEP